jgi:hypothetical protein
MNVDEPGSAASWSFACAPLLPMHLPETCYCLGMPKETEKYFRRLRDPEGIVKALLPGCPAADSWSRPVRTCGTAAGVVRCR